MPTMPEKPLAGLDLTFTNDIVSQYTLATTSGFSFVCVDLFHPKLLSLCDKPSLPLVAETRSDLVYEHKGMSINKAVVGKVSKTIDIDSNITEIQKRSEIILSKQLSWAAHLGLPAVNIRISRPHNPNLIRVLVNFIRMEYIPIKIWLTFPMSLSCNSANENAKCVDSPWHWWFHITNLAADVVDAFGILLELPRDLPDQYVIDRWFSEPVVCLLVHTELFVTNAKGFPVLPKSHQQIIKRFFTLDVQVVLTGACQHNLGYTAYQQYLNWMWKSRASSDLYEDQSKGLEDQLQEPLQPLRDNLSSTTYSIFEMDPYKYQAYEDAIYQALCDRLIRGKEATVLQCNNNSEETSNDRVPQTIPPQVVMVLGAGRGPLVNATLNAAAKAECPVRVYVVEKNPNALYTLQSRMNHEWLGLDVHLVEGDMRNLKINERADIFVSELLGSFGDNELSPECLDGAQPLLKDDGISIPCSYTSYVAPLQSLQIHSETRKSRDITNRVGYSFETPYVVRLLNCQLLATPQPAFTFVHPKPDLNEDNTRAVCCDFPIKHDAVVHAIAGYFEATLYKDVMLSIHPYRHSPQMVSWFPLVFPFERPIYVRAGEEITVRLWRLVSSRHVWYEWAITKPQATRIHNAAGHAYKIAL